MALAPWNVLAGGKFRTDAEEERREKSADRGRDGFDGREWCRTENEKKVSKALENVAEEVGAKHITSGVLCRGLLRFLYLNYFISVAIAYLMQKAPFVFPIVGGRKVEHLLANLESLDISLSDEQIKYLESIIPFDLGFPSSMIVSA